MTQARIAKRAVNRSCPASQSNAEAGHILPRHVGMHRHVSALKEMEGKVRSGCVFFSHAHFVLEEE